MFPISRDPPEGGTFGYYRRIADQVKVLVKFPISRDPPEGGTFQYQYVPNFTEKFPISRDPPEGGTFRGIPGPFKARTGSFQFLGIPPKGERVLLMKDLPSSVYQVFPISRDPPEGGTRYAVRWFIQCVEVSNF